MWLSGKQWIFISLSLLPEMGIAITCTFHKCKTDNCVFQPTRDLLPYHAHPFREKQAPITALSFPLRNSSGFLNKYSIVSLSTLFLNSALNATSSGCILFIVPGGASPNVVWHSCVRMVFILSAFWALCESYYFSFRKKRASASFVSWFCSPKVTTHWEPQRLLIPKVPRRVATIGTLRYNCWMQSHSTNIRRKWTKEHVSISLSARSVGLIAWANFHVTICRPISLFLLVQRGIGLIKRNICNTASDFYNSGRFFAPHSCFLNQIGPNLPVE